MMKGITLQRAPSRSTIARRRSPALFHHQVRSILRTRRTVHGHHDSIHRPSHGVWHPHVDLENTRNLPWRRSGVENVSIDSTDLHAYRRELSQRTFRPNGPRDARRVRKPSSGAEERNHARSEEHTSEL